MPIPANSLGKQEKIAGIQLAPAAKQKIKIFQRLQSGDPNGAMNNCGFPDGHAEVVKRFKFQELKSSDMMIFYHGWENKNTRP